jgi:nucleoside-diphosphate-sugar epimerase
MESMAEQRIPAADLELILQETMPLWEEMRNRRIFITGGTGFFGRWLLESFLYINRVLQLNARATVLSRDPGSFASRAPHIATDPAITLVAGDIGNFNYPKGEFDYVIHAATEVAVVKPVEGPLDRLVAIQDGTAHTLRFASTHGTRKFLLTSSGAVYGRQPAHITHISEDYTGAPVTIDPASVYGEGKRASELMCALYAASTAIEFKIARCFAFAGPGLALDANFAVGNFIGDVMHGRPVSIAGDGTPLRSYLYAADLAIWLWTMLFRAPSLEIFNVGSEEAISISDLAHRVVATLDPRLDVKIARRAPEGNIPLQYVPSTQKAQRLLNLRQTVSLNESIRRMAEWNNFKTK